MSSNRFMLAMAAILLAATSRATPPTPVPGEGLLLACSHPTVSELRCNYRIASAANVLASAATIGALALPSPQFAARGPGTDPVAALIMVEARMLARSELRERVLEHVGRIAQSSGSRLRFGLAIFGNTLEVLAPVGSDRKAMGERLARAPISDAGVLPYRNLSQAIELLTDSGAELRVIALLATGRSDDRQLDHERAARFARDRNTTIYTITYPDPPVDDATGRQNRLRRLARDTGGVWVVADDKAVVPETFLTAPFTGLDNGGALSVDLGPALTGLPAGEYLVRVSMDTTSGAVHADVPIFLASSARASGSALPIDVGAQVQAPQTGLPPQRASIPQQQDPSTILWAVVATAVVLAFLLALLAALLILRHRSARRGTAQPAKRSRLQGPSIPYLVNTDGDMSSHRVTGTRFKIGRLGNNDLVLGDPSVSRHHAELIQAGAGGYRIADLESMNGVYVNGRRVRERRLADGDELEIGDVRLSFELRFDDPLEYDTTREFDASDTQTRASDTGRGRAAG